MRNLIIERIKALRSENQELKKVPADPNELELIKDILNLFKNELETLIEDESITVTGVTINKHRILST